jgi:protocatechuate 3,4-dioxygenase beta subunit
MRETLRRVACAALLLIVGTFTSVHLNGTGAVVTAGPRDRPAQSSTPAPRITSSPTPSSATPGSQEVGVVDKVAVRGGIIRGRVRLAPTNVPLRSVHITMRGAPGVRDLASATTDDEGYFELRDVAPGEYRLLATRPGFVMSAEDRGSPDPASVGRAVAVEESTVVDAVEFVLWPGAIMSGQIFSAAGEPLAGAVVHVHREQFHDGKPWPHPDSVALDLTDDFGRFRVFGLPPGNYFVSARATSGPQTSGPSGGALALGATFFPGTTVGGDGRVFQLQAGEEVGGIAFAVVPAPDTMPAPATARAVTTPAPAARPATIGGRVVRQRDGGLVSGAEVMLRSGSGARVVRTVLSDERGNFEIPGIEPGGYTVAASKRGFASLQFGQPRLGDLPDTITVGQGDLVDDITLVIASGAALEGRVVDNRGEPVVGAIVRVLRQHWVRGRQQLMAVPVAPDRSDDRGAFRLHSLVPGTYFLSATVPLLVEMSTPTWAVAGPGFTTLFPGSVSPVDAQPVALGPADDVAGLLSTIADVRPFAVSGFVEDEFGRRVRSASVSLMQRLPFASVSVSQGVSTGADGSFSVATVFPGEYTIAASPSSRVNDRVAYEQVVVTDSDLFVPLVIRRAGSFAGRITFESEADRKALVPPAVQVYLDPWEPNQMFRGSLDEFPRDDWRFEVRGLAGLRRLRVVVPNGWAVRSARVGNTDILDVPLQFNGADVQGVEIELTRRVSEVTGRVVDASGEPVPHATVVLFAEDRQRRRPDSRFVASVRADRFGRFRHRGLPPEQYFATAALDLEPGEETNPALLDRLQERQPTRFSLGEGSAQQIDVPLLDAR